MIYPPSGAEERTYLQQKDVTFMDEFHPDRTVTGTPKYYCKWDYNTIYVVPTPSLAFKVLSMVAYILSINSFILSSLYC